jgi:cell division protein FtsL
MATDKFIVIKLTFERMAIIFLFVLCIFTTFKLVKQNKEIQDLRSEIKQIDTSLNKFDGRIDDLENQH